MKTKIRTGRRLKTWQKLLLVVLCTALCGGLTALWCERVATPRYSDATARVTLQADYSVLFSHENILNDQGDLDILGCFAEELGGDAFYQSIIDTTGLDTTAAALREKIRWSKSVLDVEGRTVVIDAGWPDQTKATQIALEAAKGLDRLLCQHDVPEGAASPNTLTEQGITETARKVWPNTAVYVIYACLIGLVLSFAIFSQQPFFDTFLVIFFVIFTFLCVFPFYYLFINTISDNDLVAGGRVNFFPIGLHINNYLKLQSVPFLGASALVTVARTILGTALMVLTSAWAGFLVTKRRMWHRSFWYRALVITMYFNAGLIPWYTNMLMLGLTDNFLAYIIPGMVAPYNIILVKTYIESIPASLEESAVIDGASNFKVFARIIMPLSIPILATISIFGAVGNWNSFQDSLLLMSSRPELYTLQHRLYIYLTQNSGLAASMNGSGGVVSEQAAQSLLNQSVVKYTIAMVTIIPILLVYPFMQRYFVKGIMLGAVKG